MTNIRKNTAQVRIIGGKLKRRQVSFVDADGLRPTPDRLRETLFNWLMADIFEARVLDVCAGSGVLSFEALSRGASCATLIEANLKQAHTLTKNAHALGLDEHAQIIYGQAQNILPTLTQPFDLIFIDPPYALNLWQLLLTQIIQHHLYHKDTLIYLENNEPIDGILTPFCTQIIKQAKVGQVYASIIKLT